MGVNLPEYSLRLRPSVLLASKVIGWPFLFVACSKTNFGKVANGTCKVTVMDAVTAAYRVANDFCNLEIIDETFNIENCE